MTTKDNNLKTVNMKLDVETKRKLETLAYLRAEKLQSLCENIIKECLDANADVIADTEKIRTKFNKGKQ